MEKSAVEWLYNNLLLNPISNEDIEYNEAVFENAKVLDAQQKRSYNEEDMVKFMQFIVSEEEVQLPLDDGKELLEIYKKEKGL